MTDYFKHLSSDCIPFRRDAERLRDKIPQDATFKEGVMRWKSNNRVPPEDIVKFARDLGHPVDLQKCTVFRDAETSLLLRRYRANKSPELTGEQLFEMQAAFGRGETVVNVITGRRVRL